MIPKINLRRTITRAVIILALVCFVMLLFPKDGSALNYWDALFEIGFNSDEGRIDKKAACQQIERLIKFRNAVYAKPVFDVRLNAEIQQIKSQVTSLDAGNLNDHLPYSENTGGWRGIGIRGGLEDDHYQLSIVDPEVENWISSYFRNIPEYWEPQKKYGDFGLRVFVRSKNDNIFRIATEGHINIGDLNSSNIMRVIKQLAVVMWLCASEGDIPPNGFIEGSELDERSLRVMYGFAKDFPHLFAVFNQYFSVEKVVSGDVPESTGPIVFDVVVRINRNAIEKDYPYLGKLFSRIKSMLNYQGTLFDMQNRPISTILFDGNLFRFSTGFKSQAGRFFALDKNSNIIREPGVDLTVAGKQEFYMLHTFRLNMVGLKMNIEALKVDLVYYHDVNSTYVAANVRQTPEKITTEGLILGFIPVSLIDFFIPSNIEDMTQAFFRSLASGTDNDGLSIKYGNIPKESSIDYLWLVTDAEVMSNGIIKIAFDMQRKIIRDEDELLEDIRAFSQLLWNAFYLDYLRIKSLNFCH